jgi:hypothetical protein
LPSFKSFPRKPICRPEGVFLQVEKLHLTRRMNRAR